MKSNQGLKNEKRVLRKLGAQRQIRSGGIPGFPADGKRGKWMIEVKTTEGKMLRIDEDWLRKVEDAALRHGKQPMLAIVFARHDPEPIRTWICVPSETFERLGFWETCGGNG